MATNDIEYTTSHRRTRWFVVGAILAIVFGIVGLGMVTASAANAAPTVHLSVGDRIIAKPGEIAGCNVGEIKKEQRTATTAGHCFRTNAPVYSANGVYIGKAIESSGDWMKEVSTRFSDYSIIQLSSNVVLGNDLGISGTAAPQVGERVWKHGHGLGIDNIEADGVIVQVNPEAIVIRNMAVASFDSGSPIYVIRGGKKFIVGVASGATNVVDAALNHLKAANLSPYAGLSVATNITSVPR